jgi:hypothetical protein
MRLDRSLLLHLVLAGTLLPTGPAPAQRPAVAVVTGEISAPDGTKPLEGVLVSLLDSTDVRRAAAFSGERGRFVLPVIAPGTYRVRAEVVGRISVTTDGFAIAADDSIHRRITAGERVAVLNTVQVIERAPCITARMHDGTQTAALWEETSKALRAASFTDESQMLRFTILVYGRVKEPRERATVEQRFDTVQVTVSRPFASRTPAELAQRGYVTVSRTEMVYHAPVHEALLSPTFLMQHCFWTVPDTSGSGLIGLSFEPIQDIGRPDVRGTFWIDAQTGEVRSLEFHYTGVATADVIPDDGGQLEFQRLPNGAWIVSRWHIRMPVIRMVARGRVPPVAVPMEIREAGGRVLEFASVPPRRR